MQDIRIRLVVLLGALLLAFALGATFTLVVLAVT